MKKIFRGKILGHDWYFRVGKRINVDGVNSTLSGGDSVLFWEFDGRTYNQVLNSLIQVQGWNELPPIIVMQASVDTSWHAVCWQRTPWLEALSIVAGTRGIDPDYVKLAASRKHFTLRMTDKGRGSPKFHGTLSSPMPETANANDLQTAVKYGAWVKG